MALSLAGTRETKCERCGENGWRTPRDPLYKGSPLVRHFIAAVRARIYG